MGQYFISQIILYHEIQRNGALLELLMHFLYEFIDALCSFKNTEDIRGMTEEISLSEFRMYARIEQKMSILARGIINEPPRGETNNVVSEQV